MPKKPLRSEDGLEQACDVVVERLLYSDSEVEGIVGTPMHLAEIEAHEAAKIMSGWINSGFNERQCKAAYGHGAGFRERYLMAKMIAKTNMLAKLPAEVRRDVVQSAMLDIVVADSDSDHPRRVANAINAAKVLAGDPTLKMNGKVVQHEHTHHVEAAAKVVEAFRLANPVDLSRILEAESEEVPHGVQAKTEAGT